VQDTVAGGTNRRKRGVGSGGAEVKSVGSDASMEISEGLDWTNFHWLDFSEVSQCEGLEDVEL